MRLRLLGFGEARVHAFDRFTRQHQRLAAQNVVDVEAGEREHVNVGDVASGFGELLVQLRRRR